jgi:hypothetical protein
VSVSKIGWPENGEPGRVADVHTVSTPIPEASLSEVTAPDAILSAVTAFDASWAASTEPFGIVVVMALSVQLEPSYCHVFPPTEYVSPFDGLFGKSIAI